ncbi:hypothetical protein SLH49_07780 [Cognatiyoonia sp. IB215446]|uniref:hypothetical protein n=1 Tax=Cognatiyoonia sp. IB215446 TaxID=3097355 RepID=UPI002A14A40C|nr:hypothetical protein [Cognatiyoonia sp. IB215446]MDX8347882.1 hypothetical protein [Cognatiyoonia sp. IB215446]
MKLFLDILAFLALAGFALLIVGLGYFVMTVGLNFGWIAIVGFLAFVAFVGILEGAIQTVMLAPFYVIKAIFGRRKPVTSDELNAEGKAELRLMRNGVLSCFAIGAMIAIIQFIITGGMV